MTTEQDRLPSITNHPTGSARFAELSSGAALPILQLTPRVINTIRTTPRASMRCCSIA